MLKLPFRYVLSAGYAKMVIENIVLAAEAMTHAGFFNLLVLLDPVMRQHYHWHDLSSGKANPEQIAKFMHKELFPDEDTARIVKEVCIDFKLGEIKITMWNKMNAGYVFRRIYLPMEWKELFTEAEIKAIIGHELGHLKLGSDAMVPMRLVNRVGDELLFSMLPVHTTGYFLILMSIVSGNLSYLKAVCLTFLYRLMQLLVENHFSRKDEYRADQYGAKASGAKAMREALKKIDHKARTELWEGLFLLTPIKQAYYRWLVKKEEGMFREALLDHPFLPKRLQALTRIEPVL